MDMPVTHVRALHASLRRARFEIIPMKGVEAQLPHLPTEAPVTVTASPSQGLDATIDLAARVADVGHRVVPHLSARLVQGPEHLRDVMGRFAQMGVEEYFVPAGDATEAAGPYEGAADLLPVMRDHGFTGRIGITGYPESHSFIDDETTIAAMSAKAPYATDIVSQICFDSMVTKNWIVAVRARGVNLPIHIGLPGVVPLTRLLKISMRVGLGDSVRFLRKQHGVASRLLTGYTPDHLVGDLAPSLADPAQAIVGWHLFTFNAVEATAAWWRDQLAATETPDTDDEPAPAFDPTTDAAVTGPADRHEATPDPTAVPDPARDPGTDHAPSPEPTRSTR